MPTFPKAQEARDEPLTLPVPGLDGVFHNLTIQPASGEAFMAMATTEKVIRATMVGLGDRLAADDVATLERMSQQDYIEMLIGADVLQQMIDYRVGQRYLQAVCLTAQTWHLHGVEMARKMWNRLALGIEDDPDPTVPTRPGKPRANPNGPTGSPMKSKSRKKRKR